MLFVHATQLSVEITIGCKICDSILIKVLTLIKQLSRGVGYQESVDHSSESLFEIQTCSVCLRKEGGVHKLKVGKELRKLIT